MSNTTLPALAIDGGQPIRKEALPIRRLFGEEEKQAVVSLFDRAIAEGSHLLGYNGEQEVAYCQAFVDFMGGGFADGVNSGTNAVYVALRALEMEPGDEVIVPPISDPGGVMPVVMCQLVPVPVDCEPDFYNMDPAAIEAAITDKTCAIIVAHISGRPAQMDAIMAIAKRHGLKVIEDCAQAHGAKYHGKPVGTLGDIASFSTMFGKHHASGGQGGIVYTRHEDLYWKVRQHADRGKPFGVEDADGNVAAGLNCNMDELHAAIGCVQMSKLPGRIQYLRKLAKRLEAAIAPLKAIRMVGDPVNSEGVFWFVVFHVDFARLSIDKVKLLAALGAEGLTFSGSYLHSPMVWPWFKQYRAFGNSHVPWPKGDARGIDLPNVKVVDREHITCKIHEAYTETDVDQIAEALVKVESVYFK